MDVKARVSSGDELLNEKFTIPSIITTPNPLDFNAFTTPGIYYVGSHSKIGSGDTNFVNGPIDNWGTLIVSGTRGTLFQLFFADTNPGIYHRFCGSSNTWHDWTTLVDKTTILDKAFPVGYSYLSSYRDTSYLPSFGTWSVNTYGTINRDNMLQTGHPIYEVTRTE